jgi:hypothetical protein
VVARRSGHRLWATVTALVIAASCLGVLPTSARADLIAAYDHPVGNRGLDIGLVDLSTGSALSLPSGVNTAADESHPELSGDGSVLIFDRAGAGIVVVGLRPPTFDSTPRSPPAGDPPFLTPGISPRGDGTVMAQGDLISSGAETMPSARLARANVGALGAGGLLPTLRSTDHDVCEPPGFEPVPIGSFDGPVLQGFPGRGTADASIDIGSGGAFMAWSTSVMSTTFGRTSRSAVPTWNLDWMGYGEVPDGAPISHPVACVTYGTTLLGTSSVAYLQGTTRFSAVTFERVPINSDTGAYGPGDLGNLTQPVPEDSPGVRAVPIPPQVSSMYPSGSPSDPTMINTPLDEHSPSWSQDGRYLAFVRSFPAFGKEQLTGSVREAIEVFDNQSQRLVEPDGFTIDTITPSNEHAVRNHMSIALDPTIFHVTCFSLPGVGAAISCIFTSGGPAGALIMRVVGHRRFFTVVRKRLRVHTVPKLKLFGVVQLGHKPRRFRVRVSSLRVRGRRLPRGKYLIFIRARTRNLKLVRDLSKGIPVTVRR